MVETTPSAWGAFRSRLEVSVTINTNLNALRAVRRLDEAGSARGRTFERLATGSRINHASDDAAGLSVASSLNLESRVHSQAVRNISDGMSFLNVADGAAKELKNILARLRELSTQSSNGTFSNVQRASLDKEVQALQAEYNRVVETAKFNGTSVFGGTLAVQAGTGVDAVLTVGVPAKVRTLPFGDGTFQARMSFDSGASPLGVAVADFDGDGVPDLVTINNGSSRASVLLGNGDGTFKARRSFNTGTSPNSVAVADFDGDGVADLVTTDKVGNTTSVLLGNGDGTFQARTSFAAGMSPTSVAVADFDGDGVLDLVTTNQVDNTLSVLLGNGDGTFQARTSFDSGVNPNSVAVADFDGDGVADLVTTNRNINTTSVLLGNGDGTFKARRSFVTGPDPWTIVVADLNGDGVGDIVTEDASTDSMSVLLGNGDGTFKARKSFATGSSSYSVTAVFADFNGDGVADFVTINNGSATLSVLFGNGDGTFQARRSFNTGTSPASVAAADVNGDGVLDLVVAENSGTASVLLGNGATMTSVLTPLAEIGVAAQGAALAAQGRIDAYLDEVNFVSGAIGVGLSRLAVASAHLQANIEATKAAEARITDANVAEEAARLVSTGILQQAAAAVLAHANQEPALALKLLRT